MADLSPEIQERIVALVHQVCDLRKITGMESPYAHAVYLAERLFHELPKPVDPDLIEARRIAKDNLLSVSEMADRYSEYATAIDAGEYDNSPKVGVTLALAAIKRGRELERN